MNWLKLQGTLIGTITAHPLLANAFEAVIAAVYLDGGMEPVRRFVEKHVVNLLDTLDDVQDIERLNHKSVLQERSQAMGLPTPRYFIVETSGPEHAKVFTVEVRVGLDLSCRAQGTSKKVASQRAAESLIEKLDALESRPPSRLPQSSVEFASSCNMPASSRRTS